MRFFWLVSAVVLTAVPAQADEAREALSEFAKCSGVTAVIERLQCYDNAAVAAKMALAAPPATQPQAAVQTEEESGGVLQWFGLSDNRPPKKAEDFGRPPPPPDAPKGVTEISARVEKFGRTGLGRAIFTLDNGQVWTQIEGDTIEVRDAHPGDEVTVEKAFFGSYSLVFRERKGLIKVRRTK